MADSEVITARQNIRIEIHNNLMEAMDVDDSAAKLSDGEEGEIIEETVDFDDIIDGNIKYPSRPTSDHQNKIRAMAGFKDITTGISVFDKMEHHKHSERANRFHLNNDDIMQALHDSLGINTENEKEVCFDTLHLYGINNMNSYDIIEYFSNYAPADVEWLDYGSCNALYADDVSSAMALFYKSKRVKGMPVETTNDNKSGKSILLKNNNGESSSGDEMCADEVTLADIKMPIPAGYWRLGAPHRKSKYILIRFAKISDRRVLHTDGGGGNYKGLGTANQASGTGLISEWKKAQLRAMFERNRPNQGGMRGLISESKKAQLRGIFERNREINTKNPWGDLARSWNRDKKTEEILEPVAQPAPQLKHRLGFKRSQEIGFEDSEKEKVAETPRALRKRMYADEEEEMIKRKKALEAIKRVANPPKVVPTSSSDLRNVIRGTARDVIGETTFDYDSDDDSDDDEEEGEVYDGIERRVRQLRMDQPIRSEMDLGSRLMNRRLKFTNPSPLTIQKRVDTTDVRQRIDNAKMTKQNRFRKELLKTSRLKSPPPPQRPTRSRNDGAEDDDAYSDGDDMQVTTSSKVAVVVKKPKQPTVASTVWSREHSTISKAHPSIKDRLRMPVGARGETRKDSSASSDDESSSDDSSDSSHMDESINVSGENFSDGEDKIKPSILKRPGFRSDLLVDNKAEEHKSPLRIEINNEHYKQ